MKWNDFIWNFKFGIQNWILRNRHCPFTIVDFDWKCKQISNENYFEWISVASTEDSPIANKLKRIWFKTPIGEEQATQAVLDPVVGKLIKINYFQHWNKS